VGDVSRFRSALVALGVVTLGLGLALAVVPAFAPSLPSEPLVLLPAAVLGLLAFGAVQRRRRTDREQADLGEPETRRTFPHPGETTDHELALDRTGKETRAAPHGVSLRERIRPIAIDVLTRTRNCSVEDAEGLLETGEWTEDRYAAAFFSSSRAAEVYAEEGRVIDALMGSQPSRSDLARRAILELSEMDETAPFEYGPENRVRDGAERGDGEGQGGDTEDDPDRPDGTPETDDEWVNLREVLG